MEDLNKKDGKINKPWWQDSVMLFTQLSGWIGIPVILGIFLGRWLDQKYGTEPWLFLTTVGAAFIISMVGIVKEAGAAMEKIEQESKNKKNDIRK
ncbi:MAG: AtpZ/AtpI family protein [Candidatus Parcubacteria bacterium]|nr:AtpZ/AtpI family protein [Candidatus Parcubacteria bacterium]